MMRGFLLALLQGTIIGGGAFSTTVDAAPTVTLTVTPVSGISPLTVTVAWSSTGASSCVASGGWTGVKEVSGSEVKTGLLASRTYTLTCSEGSGIAEVSWTPPTSNTDGTPIPATGPGALAGYKLYAATSTAGVPTATPVVISSPTTLNHTITGLPAGTWYFGAKAFNASNVDSDMSGLVNKVITLASASASATVTVTPKPMPPVVTVAQVAYEITRDNRGLYRLGKAVGSIELGMACGDYITQKRSAKYHEVPLDFINLTRMPKSAIVVAQCAAAS
jgi:hypothetical protein